MKVVAFNGSPRKDGNTAILIREVFKELEREGIETELVQLAGRQIRGCLACYKCFETKDGTCVQKDDLLNELVEKMTSADGIILGSPVYVGDLTADTKGIIDRATMVSLASDFLFHRKVGAAVVAQRRAGAMHVFNSINHFLYINQMVVPGSTYWNIGIGRNIGEVKQDEEGLRTMRNLGKNMAWLLNKLQD